MPAEARTSRSMAGEFGWRREEELNWREPHTWTGTGGATGAGSWPRRLEAATGVEGGECRQRFPMEVDGSEGGGGVWSECGGGGWVRGRRWWLGPACPYAIHSGISTSTKKEDFWIESGEPATCTPVD
mgnify:CR=1 FL=1